MSPRFQSLLASLGAVALIAGALSFLVYLQTADVAVYTAEQPAANTSVQTASVDAGLPLPIPPAATTTESKKVDTTKIVTATAKPVAAKPAQQATTAEQNVNQVTRVQNPYPFPPQSSESVSDVAHAALVNILCMPRGGTMQPISGSGVIIDPRGVVLTNAHVAQYVLLSQSPQVNLSCTIRTGTPATAHWIPETLYVPPVWVEAHVGEIKIARPQGTGEHDYGLLLITKSLDDSPLPSYFPSLPVDAREAIGFQDDHVLIASYPAEFLGGSAAQFNLYPVTSVTTIRQLLTFVTKTVDLFSLGGVIEAQSGSSGGAVVNAWGRLVGLISTTSDGYTTTSRDLRAITLSYISRDLAAQTQFDLPTILGGDVTAEALDFNTRVAPHLIDLYVEQLSH